MNISGKNLCKYCFSPVEENDIKCPNCNEKTNTEICHSALREGTVLNGRYLVGRVLGKGGFGITYHCYDLTNEVSVAIKEFLPESFAHRNYDVAKVSVNDEEQIEYFRKCAKQFYREAVFIHQLNGNPNIISVYEFFYENNTSYYVMEYLEGEDLKEYLRSGKRVSESEALYIIVKILDALTEVHEKRTLHRDIKPDNIFLCPGGLVKLIDFGAARRVVNEGANDNAVIVTPGFAPSEQYQKNGNQGPWTDIYALGATLYYLLTGKTPLDAMSRLENDTMSMSGFSNDIAEIIKKMMAVQIEERYRSAIEVKNDIMKLGIELRAPMIFVPPNHSFCTCCGTKIPLGKELCEDCLKNEAAIVNVAKPKTKIKWYIPTISAAAVTTIALVAILVPLWDSINDKDSKRDEPDWVEVVIDGNYEETISNNNDGKNIFIPDDEQNKVNVTDKFIETTKDDNSETVGEDTEDASEDTADAEDTAEDIADDVEETYEESDGLNAEEIIESAEAGTATEAENNHTHSWGYTQYEPAHPHNAYHACVCGVTEYTGEAGLSRTDCLTCNPPPEHTHKWSAVQYEPGHPHKAYHTCSCGASEYTGGSNGTNSSCITCNPPRHTHAWSETKYEPAHPHKGYRVCACGASEYTGSTAANTSCLTCYPITKALLGSGDCGANLKWKLNTMGVLTIYGSGPMSYISAAYMQPWYSLSGYIYQVSIENGATTISDYAFQNCRAITSVSIPSSVVEIGTNAFTDCKELKTVSLSYGLKTIKDYAFSGCKYLSSIQIPDSVTNIGNWTFWNCDNLKSATLSYNITSIGVAAFRGCTSLSSISIPERVTRIETYAFYDCSSLKIVSMSPNTNYIGESAFHNCTSLKNISLPNKIKIISDCAFANCTSISSITIPYSTDDLGWRVFEHWRSDQTINFESSKYYVEDMWGNGWAQNCDADINYNV